MGSANIKVKTFIETLLHRWSWYYSRRPCGNGRCSVKYCRITILRLKDISFISGLCGTRGSIMGFLRLIDSATDGQQSKDGLLDSRLPYL